MTYTGQNTTAGIDRATRGCASAGPILLESGTVVTLTALSKPDSTFIGWTVTMTGHRTVTATFVQ